MTHITPAHRVEKGLMLAHAVLEATARELQGQITDWRPDTVCGLVLTALELVAETAKIAETLPEPDLSMPHDLLVPIDASTRRMLDLKAAGLGRPVERLAASMLRRGARSVWTEQRRTPA